MTALASEETAVDLDEALWTLWKEMDVPEGYRAEIIEGFIEVSPAGRLRHGIIIGRLLRGLVAHLAGTSFTAWNDINVIHGFKPFIPDVCVAPADIETAAHPEGLGVLAEAVSLVVEVVSPGHDDRKRDRIRKRRAYARAGIPIYVLIDDYDEDGTITVLTEPNPKSAEYDSSHRYAYGSDPEIPEGPAKGFVITSDITANTQRGPASAT